MHSYLRSATGKRRDTIELIRQMVACETPSGDAAGANRFADLLAEQTRDIAVAKKLDCGSFGSALRLDFKLPGKKGRGQLLGLGHSDTVWPAGTLQHMPWREAKGRLWGPGVLDMKSGLAFFLGAARLLVELDVPVPRQVALLVVPDEEVGSLRSRPLTEQQAGASEAVLVLEPGTGLTGKLKTARKGVGRYLVTVRGRAAHAGVDFADGVSAIVELAHQIVRISALTDLDRGTTVNPGVIRGGTRSNVVPAEAAVEVDVRAVTGKLGSKVEKQFRALRPHDKRCSVLVEGGWNRPPMERSKAIRKIFRQAQTIAGGMNLSLEESSTGGASDANFTAALGVPTLDGLGGVGEGAHAETESILSNRIADRVALLAGLLANL